MPDTVRRIDYYVAAIPNKPGEAARILTALKDAGVNLIAFSGFPQGRQAQADFLPEDGAAFKKAAKKVGITIGAKKTAFLIEGEDRLGAVAEVAAKLGVAGINITSAQFICAGEGRFGGLLWVKPEDVRKAAKLIGAA